MSRTRAALSGRYDLERELGHGGMATVFLARDVRHDRPVAVKVLHPDLAASISSERFLREVKITARLNHPHILPLLDSGESDALLYFVMPYVEGETLRERLDREGQLAIPDAVDIARGVADALGYAHSRGIVHRDIKPDNIMLEAGHALVADFGIARVRDEAAASRITGSGFAVGTPQYMSPEQAAGQGDLDARSDLYSLGCVLYEMLSGAPPFHGPNPHLVMARRFTEEAPSVRKARDSVPRSLDAVLRRTLKRTPEQRYQTAAELIAALAPGSTSQMPTFDATMLGASTEGRVNWVIVTGVAAAVVAAAAFVWFAES